MVGKKKTSELYLKNIFFRYDWTLVSDATTGSMENTQSSLLTLTNLEEGVYTFKVLVSGENPLAFGEAFANVSVFPRK